jgi:DNA polymerase-3 subunit epsilon
MFPPSIEPVSKDARPPVAVTPPSEATAPEGSDASGPCIVFVDLETTGLDPTRHEILEIAVLCVEPRTLQMLGGVNVRVRPEHLETADPRALQICGYDAEGWADALPLREALASIGALLEDALLAGHNVGFDWSFLAAGFQRVGLPLPKMDYHRLDTASLAWTLVAEGQIDSMSLGAVCAYIGIDRPTPHRAYADAMCSLEVARFIVRRGAVGGRVLDQPDDEHAITTTLLDRLEAGRSQYGPWNVHDGRDYEHEALEEVLDGLHYVAAALVKRRQGCTARRRRVYVCHPFAGDPLRNIERVRAISQLLIEEGVLPIASHLYLPQLIEETTRREQALSLCLELLSTCDEVRVFGDLVTEGMDRELREAKRLGIPVHFVREVQA